MTHGDAERDQTRGIRRTSAEHREATRRIILDACLRLEKRGKEPSIMAVWEETGRTVAISGISQRSRHNDIVRDRRRAFRLERGLPVDDDPAAPEQRTKQGAPTTLDDALDALSASERENARLAAQVAAIRAEADAHAAAAKRLRAELRSAKSRIATLETTNANLTGGLHERLPIHRGPHVGPMGSVTG